MPKEELKTMNGMPEALSTVKHPFKDWVAWNFIKTILKKEAIKRVKSCCPNDNIGGIPLRKDKRCIACERDIWFYGLTEEDLK